MYSEDYSTFQDELVRLLLAKVRRFGFVLSGGKALVELKLSNRPTMDIDLFTKEPDLENFAEAVAISQATLFEAGYRVTKELATPTFARLTAEKDGCATSVEFGYDYREFEPMQRAIGPVLDERDAILNKVSALYARALPRDFIDVYFIRKAGALSDGEILTRSHERDEGFVPEYLVVALRRIGAYAYEDFAEYEISREDYAAIVASSLLWANEIETHDVNSTPFVEES